MALGIFQDAVTDATSSGRSLDRSMHYYRINFRSILLHREGFLGGYASNRLESKHPEFADRRTYAEKFIRDLKNEGANK